jgi:prepilin-type N-terminal cleavage/methylation domain-containing protein
MDKKAFTLVEIMVVIAIIGILGAVITPNAFKAIEKAKVARVTADTKSIKSGGLAFYSDIGLWPPDVCPQEDPGFIRWDAYQNRCCGFTPAGADAVIQANWNGPYLEKFPILTPWAGSYDWEYWPAGGWTLPAGTYVSVRPRYGSVQQGTGCGYIGDANATAVPNSFEIKLQQAGVDEYAPSGVNVSDDHVIIGLSKF